ENYLHGDSAARDPFAASGRRAVGRDQAPMIVERAPIADMTTILWSPDKHTRAGRLIPRYDRRNSSLVSELHDATSTIRRRAPLRRHPPTPRGPNDAQPHD